MLPSLKRRALWLLLLLVPAPTLGTLILLWFPATLGTALGKALYMACKLWILLLPLVWWLWVERRKPSWSPPHQGGLLVGLGLGLVLGGSVLAVWYAWGTALVDVPAARAHLQASGVAEPAVYLALSAYLALVNSLLEEYVWRWFAFLNFETLFGTRAAVILAALAFTLHHVFVLRASFSWTVTLLGALGVCSGGLIWSWCYGRYRSVWPGYLSHLLVDVAVLWIGWQILVS